MTSEKFKLDRSAGAFSLHRQLLAGLRAEFSSLSPGSRLPSRQSLAERFHCAPGTITRVLDALEQEGVIIKRERVGMFTCASQVRKIYFLTPCPAEVHQFDDQLFRWARQEAERIGVELVPIWISRENDPEIIDWKNVERIPVHAPVIVHAIWYYRIFDFLNDRQANVAFIDEKTKLAENLTDKTENWIHLEMSHQARIHAAVVKLADQGCRKILFLHKSHHINTPEWKAFRLALQQAHLRYYPELALYASDSKKNMRIFLQGYCHLGFEFDAVLSTDIEPARVADELRANFPRHPNLPIVCCGGARPEYLPANVEYFGVNYAAACAEAVRLLAAGKHGPLRMEIPYTSIPPKNRKEKTHLAFSGSGINDSDGFPKSHKLK